MTDSPTTVIHPSKSQITIFDFGQSVREHFSVTAFPTIKAFELLHEDELLEPPPPLRAFSKSTAVSLLSYKVPSKFSFVFATPSLILSSELLAHESIKPKTNTKIVGKKRGFSFFIEPQVCPGKIIIYSNLRIYYIILEI